MASWAGYILGPVYASLPKRWRYVDHHSSARFMARCAIVSGVIESIAALLVLRFWYMKFFGLLGSAYAHAALDSADENPITKIAPEVVGGAGFLVFAASPLTWLILYFAVEGILRLAAAVVTGEVCGILPLCAVDFAHHLATRGRSKEELPLVRDEVLPGDAACDLKIASCRKRPDWKYPFTIRYERAFFQVVAEHFANAGPRPYIYSLRRLPPGEVARGLREYHPDDVLVPVARVESLG
jgi:hypothetical protein